jgi:hypothetical protein
MPKSQIVGNLSVLTLDFVSLHTLLEFTSPFDLLPLLTCGSSRDSGISQKNYNDVIYFHHP